MTVQHQIEIFSQQVAYFHLQILLNNHHHRTQDYQHTIVQVNMFFQRPMRSGNWIQSFGEQNCEPFQYDDSQTV